MLIPPGVRIFVALEPVDLRASFYRLASIVQHHFQHDPKSGHLYLFLGKRRDLVKLLFWDRHGYCLFAKKLETGRFRLFDPPPDGSPQREVDFAELTLLLEGIDLRGARRRPFYRPPRFDPDS
jgi:transposase